MSEGTVVAITVTDEERAALAFSFDIDVDDFQGDLMEAEDGILRKVFDALPVGASDE